jgi:hypothetical protein
LGRSELSCQGLNWWSQNSEDAIIGIIKIGIFRGVGIRATGTGRQTVF